MPTSADGTGHPVHTSCIDLSSSPTVQWTLQCTDDPLDCAILPPPPTHPATVPGTVLHDLRALLPDPNLGANNLDPIFLGVEHASFSYSTTFHIPATLCDHSHTELRFEALHTEATVSLNGRRLFRSDNAFHRCAAVIPPGLLRAGANVLRVDIRSVRDALARRAEHVYREWNDPVGGISRVRTPQYAAGWDWGPRQLCCAIPAPVSLAVTPAARVLDISCTQRFASGYGAVDVDLIIDVGMVLRRSADGLNVQAELAREGKSLHVACDGTEERVERVAARGKVFVVCNEGKDEEDTDFSVVRFRGSLRVENPKLWWPNGMGEQHLYDLTTTVTLGDVMVDTASQRIGLREMRLVRETTPASLRMDHLGLHSHSPPVAAATHGDTKAEAESFTFCVNGRRLFAKGANYIPTRTAHSAPDGGSAYTDVLASARAAHMNMVRVWGGGVYEEDAFYDACDALGILVWQDFMFACSLYPSDDAFIESVDTEARYQVSRLRSRACLALWCGNNEAEQEPGHITRTSSTKAAYERIFYDLLPRVVKQEDGVTQYWPCSPHNPAGYAAGHNCPVAGDTHFWDVWHARRPVSAYLHHSSRFCSEFGMQSYVSAPLARRFAEGDMNVYSATMEAHQKNAGGNAIIMDYCQRQFRLPASYAALAYQSQLNQAECMRTGVEHFRRAWPFCAGALYWQLNDCWPAFSWSGLEHGGNWKALHYAARRFFSPLLLSAVHRGRLKTALCNVSSLSEDTGCFALCAVYDGMESQLSATLTWEFVNVQKPETIGEKKKNVKHVTLVQDESINIVEINATGDGSVRTDFPPTHVLRARLESTNGTWKSTATGWLCPPRYYELPQPVVHLVVVSHQVNDVKRVTSAAVQVSSETFVPFFYMYIDENKENSKVYTPPCRVDVSDNFMDLFANDIVTLEVTIQKAMDLQTLQSKLSWTSLVNSYMH